LLKARNKKFSLIMAIVFALTMVFPFAAFASTIEPLNQPITNDNVITPLGTVFFNFTAGQLKDGSTVNMRLPDGFKFLDTTATLNTKTLQKDWSGFGSTVATSVYQAKFGQATGNYFELPENYGSATTLNGLYGNSELTVNYVDDNEISVTVNGEPASGQNCYMYLHLNNIYVDSGFNGDIDLTLDAPSNSGFQSGSVVVGRTSSSGSVDMEVTNVPTFSNSTSEDGSLKIRIKEDVADTIVDKNDSIKLKLPNGFSFTGTPTVKKIWGSFTASDKAAYTDDNAYLAGHFKLDDDEMSLNLGNTSFTSQDALSFEVLVDYTCDDETAAQLGDVVAKLTGSKSTITESELTVGKYGQYDVSISADDPPTIYAGATEQVVAAVNLEESIKESLMVGRTVTLKLPEGAKWAKIDDDSDNGVRLDFSSFPGQDGQTAKWVVDGTKSTDAASLALDDLEVVTKPSFSGDLVAEVGGTAGLSGELVLAKVVTPVTMSCAEAPTLVIGKGGQSMGDITITEAEAGTINDNNNVLVDLPQGIRFDSYKVNVTSGDLKLYDQGVTTASGSNTDDNSLVIPIDSTSTEASTITISDIKVTVDRTAPQGDVVVKVKGAALEKANDPNETETYYDFDSVDGYNGGDGWVVASGTNGEQKDFKLKDGLSFPDYATVTSVVGGTIGTPAPSETSLSATVTLGDNGSYISDGRIMVQLRDAANALGVEAQNIFWDNATKTATFIKGDRVAQTTIGVPQVKLNGVALPTDKGAEIKDGKTYVSLSAAGVALGATATWDNTTKTATLSVK